MSDYSRDQARIFADHLGSDMTMTTSLVQIMPEPSVQD